MALSVGQVLNNRYRIDLLLGQGGMGAVYRAWDWNLNMQVAIKENLDASPRAYNQFSREAQILSRLHHPNLPRVTDYFFIPGQGQYLVMDFAEGEDLQTMMARVGVLPESQVLSWILQVCDGLSYLHNQPSPIIHRDIKPANIKVQPSGRVMLVDFGIAKFYDPRLVTLRGARAITPGYSPPEQYGTGTTDARSDVYALGATMYHLLTGHTPPESVRRMVDSMSMFAPHDLNPSISPAVEQAVLKAIAISTNDRFQTVDDLHAALTLAGGQAGAAPPPPGATTTRPRPPSWQFWRKLSSQPSWAVAGGAGLGLVLVSALVTYGVLTSFRQNPMPTLTPTPLDAAGITPEATLELAAPTTPVETPAAATATPSPIMLPPALTPTRLTPAPEPTQTLTPTPTLAPTQPQPVEPAWGGGPFRNPIEFRWRGSLKPGQAYQVTVYNVGLGYIMTRSPLLQTTSWKTDLPDKTWATGEYLWQVSVVSGGRELTVSPERTFWFSPIGQSQSP
jgi:serine/threonine protein kinase